MAETLLALSLLAVFVLSGMLLYNLIRRTGRAWKIGIYLLAAVILAAGAASALPGASPPPGQNPVVIAPANTGAPTPTSTPGAGTGTATTTSPGSGTGTTTPASPDTGTLGTATTTPASQDTGTLGTVTPPVLTVSYIDVGQADSILVQLPNGQNMLIDGGNRADSSTVIGYLRSRGVKRLDIVIATHPHEDHIGGLAAVIREFDTGQVYMPAVTTTTQVFEELVLAIRSRGLQAVPVEAGLTLDLIPPPPGAPSLSAEFAAPNGTGYDDLNNYSAVLRLVYGTTSFLFAGDAEALSEQEMLTAGYPLRADVLKVGHHGSSSSTTPAFLQAVKPRYAVISVGRGNPYGHPASITLQHLAGAGVKVFRTDYQGTIVATSDGQSIKFNQPAWTGSSATAGTGSGSGAGGTSGGPGTVTSAANGVLITAVDLKAEVVTITNTGTGTADLSGWTLVSVKGSQQFTFPAGVVLAPGQSVRVVSGPYAQPGSGVLVWDTSNIWNNDGDPAELYDARGNLVSRYPR